MAYSGYTRLSYYNPTTTNPANYIFLRHRIGNNANRESWIYYYEPEDNNSYLLPALPITSEKVGSDSANRRDYWYFYMASNNRTYQIADNFYCSFLYSDDSTNNCHVDIANMNFRTYFYLPNGQPGSSGCNKNIF